MDRSGILIKLGAKALRSRTFRESDEFMDEFIDVLTHLGGVYAKFLQSVLLGYAVASKKDTDYSKQLQVYEDNPDPGLTLANLEAIVGSAIHRLEFNTLEPIGVGSYSVVYAARLDKTHDVIVKILRPGVRGEISRDLKFLRKLSWILDFAMPASRVPMDITQMFGSFKKACLKETDFAGEVAFAHELYERYKTHPHIVIPKTYMDMCNDNVIVQDKLNGISMKDIVQLKLEGGDVQAHVHQKAATDLKYVLRVLHYDMYYSLLSGKPFHGDMHPGNVRILPNNQIALLDFGIKADPYSERSVPAVVNKLRSDALFQQGDFDLVRILEAHFRLNMVNLYDSFDALFYYAKRDTRELYAAFIKFLNISTENPDSKTREKWLMHGPASMLNDLVGGSRTVGIDVFVQDKTTQRGITTYFSLLKAVGFSGATGFSAPIYPPLCDRIVAERSELFMAKKRLMPDIALENVYLWLEKVARTNPELAHKIRHFISETKSVGAEPSNMETPQSV